MNLLSPKLTEVWNLINETALLLNRTVVRDRYKNQLDTLRSHLNGHLQQGSVNPAMLKEVQGGIIELRRQLRLAGYDLSMGKYTLVFDGFRNDASPEEGFWRMVLFIGDSAFYWETGSENHIMLASLLERRLSAKSGMPVVREAHYLWYRWSKTSLVLSGAATETKEDYEKLKTAGEADSLLFLSRLKGL
jgi:hypothetical protein